ncbi:SpaH/EbpB family LPXTG-anchored major pilin [Corynebacterium diphtheriae]|uniref:SpaH/EbpB family LPXTG-anchored major pilin n=1 Tax=Corynebacterium diphtheriae TaxID=1717 RepID=UPI00064C8DC7|nr:SpaH/EbpB family LPXTG-anchored major pilin [Corynebacterium diphtheriae]KLN42702.1 hypothetical protein AL07_01065 [Corynebacterium diphtheriae bv. gravis str. ISS 4060]MBG9264446.1 SpaH/EbpB family LPXTG-anchored major pilin [Corynebacterium diphtheriae bv. gravis]OWN27272.1 hypothetical protein AY503_10140 [Corynebacterium diphtheriae bv. gravis]OWN47415.1 hypothetical protein AY491_10835 [Corynebacterium diphtheriae bv. gravis]OWN93605.1 hypothetical protein AY524_10045 [Corynebacterium
MNKFSRTARSVTFAAIVGLSLGVSAPGAFAETAGEIANRATKGQSTITQETGTFTVHKRANQDPSNEKKPTGEVVPDAPGIPLKDATFTLYEITKNGRKIDLKTNESILEASSLVKKGWSTSDGQETYTTEGGYSAKKITSDEAAKKTTGEGTAVWDKLPIGAYLVVETDAPPSYEKSAPFVAFVPMTKGNAVQDGEAGDLGKGTEWNYDVHAYPKNYKNEAKKEVEDTNQQVGQDIVFSIVGDIPKVLGEKGLTKFEFVDDLNEQKVTFKENSEKLGAGHQNKAYIEVLGGDGQVLTTFGPEKYELEHVTGTEKLNVRLNEDGLREINTTYKETAKKLKLSFAASVIQAGELKNEATVITNNGNGQGDTETKTNETVSYWATVKIVKKDGTGEKTLQGAIFALYGSKDAVCSKDDLVERNKISTGSGGEKVQKPKTLGKLMAKV